MLKPASNVLGNVLGSACSVADRVRYHDQLHAGRGREGRILAPEVHELEGVAARRPFSPTAIGIARHDHLPTRRGGTDMVTVHGGGELGCCADNVGVDVCKEERAAV
jgi:hypothetical protein